MHEFFGHFSLPGGKWGPLHHQLAAPPVTKSLQHYISSIIYLCIKNTYAMYFEQVQRLGMRISESQADVKTQGDEGKMN